MSQFLDSFILLFGGLILVGGLLKLGSMLGGKRAPWLAALLPIVGVAGAVVGSNWALERYGTSASATVVGKREWVTLLQNGSYLKSFSLTIKTPNAAVGETVNLRADRSLFDDVVTGGVVAVRSLRIHPSFARLEAMNGQRWLAIVNDAGILPFVLGVAALFGGIFLYGGVGVAALVRKPASVLPLCVGGYITWQSARPFRGDPPAGAPLTARATVTRLRTVTAMYPLRESARPTSGWRLERPYQVVEAEFTPAGRRVPVVGVDAIDDGSIPRLAVGTSVEVQYDRSRPRIMRLAAATRNWPAVNARAVWIGYGALAALVAGLLLLLLLRLLFRRRRVR